MGTLTGPEPKGWAGWGIDLSSNNTLRPEDWRWLAEHHASFAILRASNGSTPDSRFRAHARSATGVGFTVGAYLRLLPERLAPVADQVAALVQAGTAVHASMWAIDIEPGPTPPGATKPTWTWLRSDAVITTLRRALWLTYQRTSVRPMIYTYLDFWTHWKLSGSPALAPYPLWAARYDRTKTVEALTAEFARRPVIWQYGGGWVDGVATSPKIDKNVVL